MFFLLDGNKERKINTFVDILPVLAINCTITWLSDTLKKVKPVVQMTKDILPQTSELKYRWFSPISTEKCVSFLETVPYAMRVW
jgi:hypothetical protein